MQSLKKIFVILVGLSLIYGLGRLYFATTGGFLTENIFSHLPPEPRWDISSAAAVEDPLISQALDQEYVYLGKGCQSYVFESSDGNYVIKFIKFQRFRPQSWLTLISDLPGCKALYAQKIAEKKVKLDKLFTSWKLSYEHLKQETGVLLVHLNATPLWNKPLKITDKAGFSYTLNLGQLPFLLQRKATMLSPTIERYMSEGKLHEAEGLIDRLLEMLLSEYLRGFADNDHALMQNTGVLEGRPIHIDAGQFIFNPVVQEASLFSREIYDKMYNFFRWLDKRYPTLAQHLKYRLTSLLGVDYYTMHPYVHKGDVNKIPHQPVKGP